MSSRDQVMNLFNFMMELLDEPTNTNKTDSKPTTQTKRLRDGLYPHHPVLNPYVSDAIPKGTVQSPFNDPNSLFSKMDQIDKRNANELGKLRAVKQATEPFIKTLEELRVKAHENATIAKEEEELEHLKPEIEKRMGVTIENGKTKIVEVPSILRDNIPLDDKSDDVIGYSVDRKPNEIGGLDDLPKEVRDKLDVKSNEPVPMTRPTEYEPTLKDGAIQHKPKENKTENDK